MRPKRVFWSDPVLDDGVVTIAQGPAEMIYSGSGDIVWRQEFSIAVPTIASDDDSEYETLAAQRVAAIVQALEADATCGGNAMYGGLLIEQAEDLRDESGRSSGKIIPISVIYSHRIADATQVGVR